MNKSRIKTSFSFIKNFKSVGAFKQSSERVEKEICSKLPDNVDVHVIEFGMGHGNITRHILNSISPNSKVTAFEINQEFCELVEQELNDDRLEIVNDSAMNIDRHVKFQVDFIIGSLPFTFFSRSERKQLGSISYQILKNGGFYSQYLYNRFMNKTLSSKFDDTEVVPILNLPMEYVYHWRKNI